MAHIEITQATQDESNAVPLIAGKPTFVRVYLDCGEGCSAMPGVTGVLRGYGPTGELSGSPRSPTGFQTGITAYHESWQSQRGNLGKTLNFTLPPEWTDGTITLTAEIAGSPPNQPVQLSTARVPNILYLPVRFVQH